MEARPLFKKRNKGEWDRFIIGADSEEELQKMDFYDPSLKNLKPLEQKCYLLEYLQIAIPKGQKCTVQCVIDHIPKELLEHVYAFELTYIISMEDAWMASCFKAYPYGEYSSLVWIALLTEINTGKDLPIVRLKKMNKPIGCTEEDWKTIRKELSLSDSE